MKLIQRTSAILCAAFLLFLAATVALAEDKPDTPNSLPGGKVISVEDAKKLVDSKGAIFLDTRSVINFGKGHIPGATSVSYKEKSDFKVDFDASQDQLNLSKLPADKAAKLVFYSDGPKGWKSYKAAVVAIKSGYKSVMWMRDGSGAWIAKGYPTE
jgi:rhodanese-related sulfurtransferase